MNASPKHQNSEQGNGPLQPKPRPSASSWWLWLIAGSAGLLLLVPYILKVLKWRKSTPFETRPGTRLVQPVVRLNSNNK